MHVRTIAVAAGLLASTALPVIAHHSASAEFDLSKKITIKGTITRVDWTNPHAWIDVAVDEPGSQRVKWSVETAPPGFLRRMGFDKDQIPIGTSVSVLAFPAKDGSKHASGETLTLVPTGRAIDVRDRGMLDGKFISFSRPVTPK